MENQNARVMGRDLEETLEAIDALVLRAQQALDQASTHRTTALIAATQGIIDDAWQAIADARDEAYAHPCTETWLRRAADRLFTIHRANHLFASTSGLYVAVRPKILSAAPPRT